MRKTINRTSEVFAENIRRYESLKKTIKCLNLSPGEYQARIKETAKRLGVGDLLK